MNVEWQKLFYYYCDFCFYSTFASSHRIQHETLTVWVSGCVYPQQMNHLGTAHFIHILSKVFFFFNPLVCG